MGVVIVTGWIESSTAGNLKRRKIASGHLVGAVPTGSGTATHLGQWTTSGTVKYIRK